LPKQNRPLVRDGRLQVNKKKRTDRSYLRGTRVPTVADPDSPSADGIITEDEALEAQVQAGALGSAAVAEEEEAAPAASAQARGEGRVAGAVRAIQQQGVRKRREVDLQALAVADTQYAIHELRRILVLTVMVVTTLVVLGIVLR
jgi:hypothetical protein